MEPIMRNDIKPLLKALKEGSMSLEQVALIFRERTWPRPQAPATDTYEQLAKAELTDPEPYEPGSFDDVTAAYHSGDLTDEQYDVLANAMTEAVRATGSIELPRDTSGSSSLS
jgi:hypothetical protein